MRDITERNRLEEQVKNAQKMEAIGNLAGGIAHEFNNALMGVMGRIELLALEHSHDQRIAGSCAEMKNVCGRMAGLTNQLLAYARGGKYHEQTMRLSRFVQDSLPIVTSDIDGSVRVETHFSDIAYSIVCDPTQMQMVLSSILNNSLEAMEGGGRIVISTTSEEVDDHFARERPGLKPGSYACLAVEDNGKGMDEETLKKIFDPFFSTKFAGRGLGMAAVYGIVKNHDGWIGVESEQGGGTVVKIYLPAVLVQKEIPLAAHDNGIYQGAGTVLLIDNSVGDVTRVLLEKMEYTVLEAKNGRDALDIADRFAGDIELALMDVGLTDMSSKKVYSRLMRARPFMKVIVCSGHSPDGSAREIMDAGADAFMEKPFTMQKLSKNLKRVMD